MNCTEITNITIGPPLQGTHMAHVIIADLKKRKGKKTLLFNIIDTTIEPPQ